MLSPSPRAPSLAPSPIDNRNAVEPAAVGGDVPARPARHHIGTLTAAQPVIARRRPAPRRRRGRPRNPSLPAPPRSTSSPAPPRNRSLPGPPTSTSSPPSAQQHIVTAHDRAAGHPHPARTSHHHARYPSTRPHPRTGDRALRHRRRRRDPPPPPPREPDSAHAPTTTATTPPRPHLTVPTTEFICNPAIHSRARRPGHRQYRRCRLHTGCNPSRQPAVSHRVAPNATSSART